MSTVFEIFTHHSQRGGCFAAVPKTNAGPLIKSNHTIKGKTVEKLPQRELFRIIVFVYPCRTSIPIVR